MTIATKLTELNTVKGEIHDAIEAKGVSLTGVEFRDYSTKIAEITSGTPTDYNVVYNSVTETFQLEHTWYGSESQELSITGLAGSGTDVKFSADGMYCAVGCSASPYIYVFSRTGSTFTKLSDPYVLPTATINSITWDGDNNLFCCTSSTLSIYNVLGSTVTHLSNSTSANHIGTLSYNLANNLLVILSGGTVRNFEIIAGEPLAEPTLHCTYNSSVNGDDGKGTLTGSASGATISGNRLNLTGGTSKYVTYNGITFNGLHTKGTVIFRYTPNAAGANNYIFAMANGNNRNNCFEVRIATGNQLVVSHWNSTGSGQVSEVATGTTFSSGVTYEIAISWDTTTPSCMAYVNGTRVGNWSSTWGTRTNSLAYLIVGSVIDNPSAVTANFYLDDLYVAGDQFLTASSYTPYNGVYSTNTITDKSSTFNTATGTVNHMANIDGKLAVACSASPYLKVYNYNNGTNQFVKVSDPVTIPSASSNSVAWNESCTRVAIAYSTSVAVYSFNGTALTYLTTITTSTTSKVGWYIDKCLVITNSTDGIRIYDSEFSLITNPSGININNFVSSYDRFLIGSSSASTYVEAWKSYPSGSFVDKNLKVT